MRPIDLAREHGLSAQAIRNYDAAGIFPPTERSATGYRRYTPLHAQALRTFLALRDAHGHQQAIEIMRATNRGDPDSAYRLIDATHIALHAERNTHATVATALASLTTTPTPPITDPPPPVTGPPLTISELARRLDLHPATLRTWEAENILHPHRDQTTGYRQYGPDCIRDAEIARQLRRAGHPLPQIAHFRQTLHTTGNTEALTTLLTTWHHRITTRSHHLLTAAAHLHTYQSLLPHTPTHHDPHP